jgi:hypothetical protein
MLEYICQHKLNLLKGKNMKNQVTIAAVLLIAIFLLIAASGMAQDQKEKKITVKRVEVEDGKKVVKDTTFTLKEGEDAKDIISNIEWIVEGDSMKIMTDVFVDVDSDDEKIKKVIVIKGDGDEEVREEILVSPRSHRGKKRVMVYKSDDGEDVVMVMPRKHRKATVWHSDDDYEFEFDIDQDFEFDMEAFEAEMQTYMEEMEDATVIILDEKMELLDEFEELEDMEIEMIRRPRPPKHAYFEKHHLNRFDHGVTDKELRDAGIKNKPDRLEVEELDMDINEGVVTLGFSLKGEGNPKVEVYNFFGDQVFTGKPEVLDGKYTLVMDLSQKQHGIYYLQIIDKNSSLTEKIRL